jgi:ankyrin repeat protein
MAAKGAAMEGEKAILKAANSGDAARVGELLAGDASLVNARDKDGSTPLHCAAWKGHAALVAALLDAGADVNARSQNEHYGDTPLHAAAHGNQRAVAELLLARGADARAVSCNGRTPLQETAIHGATAVAKLLRERGVEE